MISSAEVRAAELGALTGATELLAVCLPGVVGEVPVPHAPTAARSTTAPGAVAHRHVLLLRCRMSASSG
ncbi:hypothetical protein GCM10017786_36740 [Amycolatopsis deserti]|uniref:Uncharacterized protein n=1 Tax=Amycolatopsis deserti TaxID=185696 RepID=A0ABQ3J4Q5_9PSEU|nr:hypothetical protein GCM10017786_36740 [Amycolatopsis deserti]